ncbi:MAG: SAM-dependent methyltransferase [Lachnospiraceae bacterium]|nr:SAM-dependent methyltransferase [Lachnospiraceae bacterium]
MQLSKRMQRLASLVTEGNRLADVGTDHGYVPIALLREKRIPSAVAMDVNQGPLARAGEHIRESGLSTYIETRLSDGLLKLEAGEADTVLVAGMGGMLIRRILEGGGHCLHTVKELILQPQSDIHRVREWLYENGYQITAEDIVEEDGKYYPMMRAVHGEERKLRQAELYYGKLDIQRSREVLYSCLQEELLRNRKVMEILKQNGQAGTRRAAEVAESIERISRCCQEAAVLIRTPGRAENGKEVFLV